VFDVSAGRAYYAPGAGYACFAGRDATRAFVSGEFEGAGLTDDVAGLSDSECQGVLTWRDFYRGEKKYPAVSRLVGGRFYGPRGEPLPALAFLEAGAARVRAARAAAAAAERAAPPCAAAWSPQAGGEVWCEPEEGHLLPRRLTGRPGADGGLGGAPRCACLSAGYQPPPGSAVELYPGCDAQATRCRTAPPTHG